MQTTTFTTPYFFIYFLASPIRPIEPQSPSRLAMASQTSSIHSRPPPLPHTPSSMKPLYPGHYFEPFQSCTVDLYHLHDQIHVRSLYFPPGSLHDHNHPSKLLPDHCYGLACESARPLPCCQLYLHSRADRMCATFRTACTGLLC